MHGNEGFVGGGNGPSVARRQTSRVAKPPTHVLIARQVACVLCLTTLGLSGANVCAAEPVLPFQTWLNNAERETYKLFLKAEAGDVEAATKLFREERLGNEWASLQLGYLIERGQGYRLVKQDNQKSTVESTAGITDARERSLAAAKHYIKAARRNPYAAYDLGLLYLKQLVIPGDLAKLDEAEDRDTPRDGIKAGVRYLLLAIDLAQGHFVHPYVQLASIYEHGFRTIEQNAELAIGYYESAAGLNDPQAQYKMGMILLYGAGRPQDVAMARMYFTRSAEQWNRNSMLMLARLDIESRQLEGNQLGQAAQWLHVAGYGSEDFAGAALPFFANIPNNVSRYAAQAARIWINAHQRGTQNNDYLGPINRNPSAR